MAVLNSPGKNVAPFEEGFVKTGSAEMRAHAHTHACAHAHTQAHTHTYTDM